MNIKIKVSYGPEFKHFVTSSNEGARAWEFSDILQDIEGVLSKRYHHCEVCGVYYDRNCDCLEEPCT